MLLFNEWHGTWFKDAFRDGEFQTDWKYIRWRYGSAEGATLVFYPHGNLSLTRNHIGEETKIWRSLNLAVNRRRDASFGLNV